MKQYTTKCILWLHWPWTICLYDPASKRNWWNKKWPQVYLDKLDDLNFVVVELIASPAYPDFVGMH